MWITSCLSTVRTPTCIALGNFDGVHRGHLKVIEPILHVPGHATSEQADARSHPDTARDQHQPGVATVVTFCPHPQEFFSGQRRDLLTPLNEKAQLLRAIGVEQLVLLPFDHTLAALSPVEFVRSILVEQLQAQRISVGQDFCFGRQRSGTTADLVAIAARYGVTVDVIPLYLEQGERISSSAIRQALAAGDLQRATRLLGRSYTLVGEVSQGQQLGRTLGFPTANLQIPGEKFVPCSGVYSVWVNLTGEANDEPNRPGVMNIGVRPTVDGTTRTVEVHLLDWSGDLYGQTLSVRLERFLRAEQKFPSLEALKAQIEHDCTVARSHLTVSPLR